MTGVKAGNTVHFSAPLCRESCHKRDANTTKGLPQRRSKEEHRGGKEGRPREAVVHGEARQESG